MLQSPRLEYHMKTIGIDQSFCNRYSFEHTFLNNIKNKYQHASKCKDQQNLKDVIYYTMVSTPEDVINDSPSLPMTSTPVKKSCAGE